MSRKWHLLSVILFIGLAGTLAVVCWSGFPIDTSGGARLINDLQAALDANPRILEAKVGGYEDLDGHVLSDVKVMEASFRIRGKEHAIITILRPRRNLLTGGDGQIPLTRVGPWVLVESSDGERSVMTRGVDVSVNGDFPLRISNVNDLVDHYDDLVNYLSQMPSRTKHLQDGRTWTREIRREPLESTR